MLRLLRGLRWMTIIVLASACLLAFWTSTSGSLPTPTGLQKIKHIVIVMQENRSFDHYFGTYPGANGIPTVNGQPTPCLPYGKLGCTRPHHDVTDGGGGGDHTTAAALRNINGGKMDGFADTRQGTICPGTATCNVANRVTVWHDAREIPNYWTYAQQFVLQDMMFQPNHSWSLPAHLAMVSGWSARCTAIAKPMSCYAELEQPTRSPNMGAYNDWVSSGGTKGKNPNFAWTDITYLLAKKNVSWGYYVATGEEPDCRGDTAFCLPHSQNAKSWGIWNPLPGFTTVQQNNQLSNIRSVSSFMVAAKTGTLPAVSWVIPDYEHSEHPLSTISSGQEWTTTLINTIMSGPNWDSTAIFVSWDDWGGFYDHVNPPVVDGVGYGLRVPGLLISPYAKKGYINHQVLSHDAYLKFIEDVFLDGQRIDPATDGRPDRRPNVRENLPILGDLRNEFDFDQAPRRPVLLDPRPKPGPASQ